MAVNSVQHPYLCNNKCSECLIDTDIKLLKVKTSYKVHLNLYLQHQIMASGLWLHVFGSHLEDLDQLRLSPEIVTSKQYYDFNVSRGYFSMKGTSTLKYIPLFLRLR